MSASFCIVLPARGRNLNDIIFFKEGMIMKFLLENISLFIDLIYYFLLSALVIVIGGVFIVAALDFNGSFMYIKPHQLTSLPVIFDRMTMKMKRTVRDAA